MKSLQKGLLAALAASAMVFLGALFATADAPSAADQAAGSATPDVYIYVREGCGFCEAALEFLADHPAISVEVRDIAEPQHRQEFEAMAERFAVPRGTPIILAGESVISGFRNGDNILASLDHFGATPTPKDALKGGSCVRTWGAPPPADTCASSPLGSAAIDVPFIGQLSPGPLSLGIFSAVLGFLDGFNPCAMWVLITFLLVLSQLGDRLRMMLVAGAFLLAQGITYGLILGVWLTAFDFVGTATWVTAGVGVLALGAGAFFVFEGIRGGNICRVTDAEKRRSITSRIKAIATGPLGIGMFFGVVFLAFAVNIIEFACSAGFPQAFALVISSHVSSWLGYAGYLLIYLGMYLFDDMLVLALALFAIEKIGITHRFTRGANLVGGAVMLLLGGLLLFFPHVLT